MPGKFISNNDLAISSKQQQQLQSNSSWMNSILSFPGDLLFGQMAHADGAPQSSYGASSSSATKQQFYSNLEANWFEKCVVGSGRGTAALGQKIEMAGIWSAERLGFVGSGVRENYIRRISVEKELYDSTPVGQSTLGKTAEFTTNLFFGYVGARTGIGTLKTAGDIIYSRYTAGKAFKGADGGGKYAGELRKYREDQGIQKLRKTISSHQKTISKHKEYIKNPKLKYQDWDRMSQERKDYAIHHWQEDIKRAKIYETFAKRVLNEKMPSAAPHVQIIPPVADIVDKYVKSDSQKNSNYVEQSNIPKPPKP